MCIVTDGVLEGQYIRELTRTSYYYQAFNSYEENGCVAALRHTVGMHVLPIFTSVLSCCS